MDNKKTLELIKLNAIGCIKPDDLTELVKLMEEDENFPWKDLGNFQNLAAVLPASLVIETPSWELKDKVARKLYNLRDDIKNQKEEPEQVEEPSGKTGQILDDALVDMKFENDELEIDEPELEEEVKSGDRQIEDFVEDKQTEANRVQTTAVDKELIEKTVKELLKTHDRSEPAAAQKNDQKTLFISIGLFIISILLIVFMYFIFSGDIDSMQEDLDKIKSRLNISLLESNSKTDLL
jgi:Fe2+ transport system protein B